MPETETEKAATIVREGREFGKTTIDLLERLRADRAREESAASEQANTEAAAPDVAPEAKMEDGGATDAQPPPVTDAKPSPVPDARYATAEKRLEDRARGIDEKIGRYEAEYAPSIKRLREAAEDVASDPLGAFRKLIGGALKLSDEEAEKEMERVYEEWTGRKLGLDAHSDQGQSETKRLRREFEAEKRERKAREEEEARRQAAREQQHTVEFAVRSLDADIRKSPERYGFLLAEENPAQIVFDTIVERFERDGTELSPAEAAQLAEDHYRDKWAKSYERRKDLLAKGVTEQRQASQATATPAESPKPETTKPAPKSLSNATEAITPSRQPKQEPRKFSDDDEARHHALRHLRERSK
jgi:hypothetical protein